MANAKRDDNLVPTLIGVSSVDGITPTLVYVNPTTNRMLVSLGTATPGGSDTQVQFNDASTLAGDAGFTYNKTTDTVTLAGNLQCEDLLLEDSDASHYLTITTTSNLTAARTLTLVPGDAARTLTISGDATISQDYSSTGNPQFATIELGAATDTTLARSGAGDMTIEGNAVYRVGGTDVAISDGGTGTSTGAMTLVSGAARTIQIGQNGTTVGDQLTISAGRALLGGTDLAGGTLVLAGGVGTGSAGSYISFQVSKAGASGTADRAVFQAVTIDGSGTSHYPRGTGAGDTGEIRFLELAANGSNYVGFKAPDTLAGNVVWTLPVADAGVSGYVLSSNAAGVLSWVSPIPTTITVANEATDTTCFPLFVTAATGDLGPKTNAGLAFNSNTGILTATGFSGPLTGDVTGNVSGTAATVTGAAQAAITSLGTLTTLTVDDITINGNTISSAGASSLAITPTAGQAILLDATISVDAGVVTGATSITSTTFVGALTGTASGNLTSGGALGTPSSGTGTNITGIPAANILAGSFGAGAYVISTSLQAATIELGHATDTTISRSAAGVIAVEGVVIPSISSTNTLTNKRITPRATTEASSATPTINTDNTDIHTITALAANITSFTTNLSGTPTEGQKLIIRIIDNGTARTIAWGASFAARGVALPTTTVLSKYLYVGFIWNTVTSTWDCIASSQEA